MIACALQRCRLRVIRVGFVMSVVCPVYPKQQTLPNTVDTAHLCRYYCQRLLGYKTQDIESWAAFTWQGRFKTPRVPGRTLRRGSFRPTFATLSANSGRCLRAVMPFPAKAQSFVSPPATLGELPSTSFVTAFRRQLAGSATAAAEASTSECGEQLLGWDRRSARRVAGHQTRTS